MQILIIGNQLFGESVLKKFREETDHNVVAVLCDQDIPGKTINPIKKYAKDNKILFFQPENYDDENLLYQIKSLKPDICVMAYVTSFIPKKLRDIPANGTICFHPSLLPLNRGPSAINWSIIKGFTETGLSIFYPNDGFDEGDIILQKKVSISPDDTLGDVYFSKIFPLGVNACLEAVDLINSGKVSKTTQDQSKATYESWCKKSDAKINWKKSGQEIYNLIRGCNPQPGAWTKIKNEEYTFYDSRYEKNENKGYSPGQIISIKKNEIFISVDKGILKVSRMKSKQGKLYIKDMDIDVFNVGDIFV